MKFQCFKSGLRILLVCCAGLGRLAFAAEDEPVVIWDKVVRVDTGMGYHDNVLRSSIATEGSGFFRTTADASLMRLSSTDTLFVLFLLGEDTRYFEGPVGYEQFVSGTAQYTTPVGESDEAGLELSCLYLHQVFDASETEANLYRILVEGYGVTARAHWQHALDGAWSARLEGAVQRQTYEAVLDDYWEQSGRLSLIREYGQRSEASLGYQLLQRDYDTRNQFDSLGVTIPGSDLIYRQQEVSGEWRHYFDADRKWRSTTKAGYMCNTDNGSGYFDYDRLLLREQLRWKSGAWDLKATGRLGWYRYAVQRVNGSRRDRSYAVLSVRAERRLGDRWLAYGSAEREWDASNDPLDEYRDWFVEAGLGYEF